MPSRSSLLAVVTLVSLAWAFTQCVPLSQPVQSVRLVAGVVMVSPFIVLFWAHARIAQGWRSQVLVALSSVPLAIVCSFYAFLMAWFKPGWGGVMVFTASLFALALVCVLPLRSKPTGGERDA